MKNISEFKTKMNNHIGAIYFFACFYYTHFKQKCLLFLILLGAQKVSVMLYNLYYTPMNLLPLTGNNASGNMRRRLFSFSP